MFRINWYTAHGVNGVATSIKSIDLTAKTYQNTAKLNSVIDGYAKKLMRFSGDKWGSRAVEGAEMQRKVLLVVTENGAASVEQAQLLAQIQRQATSRWPGISVIIQSIQ